MSERFSTTRPMVGTPLPIRTFGKLVGQFQSASHVPLRGGANTGRHLYLSVQIPTGSAAGVFECAVNIRSDEGTEVQFAQRIETLDPPTLPADGFTPNVHLKYGRETSPDDTTAIGLNDADFAPIVNDDLYQRISDLANGCDRVAAFGVTYTDGTGIHDLHMNSGTRAGDPHASGDRRNQDGAIVFYFDQEANGQHAPYATWILIKFQSQSVVDPA